MDQDDRASKLEELARLRERAAELESELATVSSTWKADEYYLAYHATTGFMMGAVAAAASLLLNIIGSLLVNQHPLELIRVYLTFPLGERALSPEIDSGIMLAVGCCLYLGTGMLLGIPFQIALTRLVPGRPLIARLVMASVLGMLVWVVNFYFILSWLQPQLFGGNWIVERIPWYVGALTHLVFGWTMALLQPLGRYVPYSPQSESK